MGTFETIKVNPKEKLRDCRNEETSKATKVIKRVSVFPTHKRTHLIKSEVLRIAPGS